MKDEVMVLVAADQEECVTNNRLQELLNTHTVNGNKMERIRRVIRVSNISLHIFGGFDEQLFLVCQYT